MVNLVTRAEGSSVVSLFRGPRRPAPPDWSRLQKKTKGTWLGVAGNSSWRRICCIYEQHTARNGCATGLFQNLWKSGAPTEGPAKAPVWYRCAPMTQLPRVPNLEAQRAAMRKLSFLAGKWSGETRLLRGPAGLVELIQTEEAGYKLEGLILTIEGVGRTKSGAQLVIQAFAIISYDDESGTYRMRAFNDGRFLEAEVQLLEEGLGMSWGFVLGEIRTKSVLRINERGEWTEVAEIMIGSEPAKKLLELTVRRQK
jgi:hypothetical protein